MGAAPGAAQQWEHSLMQPTLLRIRNRLVRTTLEFILRPSGRVELIRLGSAYGGWWIPASAAQPGAVAYCAGAGEDITFDLALHARGCRVTAFDPTPRAIAYVATHSPNSDTFRFVPTGWWDEAGSLKFYAPKDPEHVSHSAVNLQRTESFFEAAVKPIRQHMSELNDDHVDIVKMDIEGAEYRVINSILANGPPAPVLCIEFDQPQPIWRTFTAVRKLQHAGYALVKIDHLNYTFTRT